MPLSNILFPNFQSHIYYLSNVDRDKYYSMYKCVGK